MWVTSSACSSRNVSLPNCTDLFLAAWMFQLYTCSSFIPGPHNPLRCRLAVKCVPHPKSHSPPEPWTPPLPALQTAAVLIGVWLPLSLSGEAAPRGIEEGVMHWGGCGVISPSSGQALVILSCHYEVLPLLHYKQSSNVCSSFQDDPLF